MICGLSSSIDLKQHLKVVSLAEHHASANTEIQQMSCTWSWPGNNCLGQHFNVVEIFFAVALYCSEYSTQFNSSVKVWSLCVVTLTLSVVMWSTLLSVNIINTFWSLQRDLTYRKWKCQLRYRFYLLLFCVCVTRTLCHQTLWADGLLKCQGITT